MTIRIVETLKRYDHGDVYEEGWNVWDDHGAFLVLLDSDTYKAELESSERERDAYERYERLRVEYHAILDGITQETREAIAAYFKAKGKVEADNDR